MRRKLFFHPKMQPGQSLVELGLTLMVMLLLLSGAVDFGMGFFSYVALRDAAQEGALYGSIAAVIDSNKNGIYDPGELLNSAAIETRIRQSSQSPVKLQDLPLDAIAVTVTPPGSLCQGSRLTVTITYDYPISMALITTITGPTIRIHASSTSVILRPACPPGP